MLVRATKTGYYGHVIRKEGDVFEIEKSEHFSEKWMKKENGKDKERDISKGEDINDEDKKAVDELIASMEKKKR